MQFFHWAELSLAAHLLWRAKSYSLTMILTLSLTLSALLTALQLNYQILAAPLPYPQAQQLYLVRGQSYTGDQQDYANLMTVAGAVKLYQQAQVWSKPDTSAAASVQQQALVAFDTDVIRNQDNSPEVKVGFISPDYFSLLEVPMAAGHSMQVADGLGQQSAVVVISDKLWQQLYQRSPEAIGKSLQLGALSFRIIGVTAASFVEPALLGPGQHTDLWLPWDFNPTYREYKNWWGALAPDHHLLLRLTEHTDPAKLSQQLSLPLNQAYREAVDASPYAQHFIESRIGVSLQPLAEVIRADSAHTSLLALTGCLLLLCIAGVNLSQLWLARHFSQQRQQAIRVALGARSSQLIAQTFSELLWLILIASLLALLLCAATLPLIRLLAAPYLARLQELTLQPQIWLGMLLTLLPLAYMSSRVLQSKFTLPILQQQLQRSGKGASGQQQRRFTLWLLAGQASATTLLLVFCAQLGLQALTQLKQQPGFAIQQVQQVVLNHLSTKPATTAELLALRDHLSSKSGIEIAALASSTLLDFNNQSVQDSLSWPELTGHSVTRHKALRLESSYIDSQLLPLLQTRLLHGRFFTDNDQREQNPVVMMNATAAKLLLQQKLQIQTDTDLLRDNSANIVKIIGQRLLLNGDTPVEVVGVVSDFSLTLEPEKPRLWLPSFYHFLPDLLLRYKTATTHSTAQLNRWLAEVAPAYRVQRNELLSEKRQRSQFLIRLTLFLALGLSIAGLLLAAIGSYGVLSYQLGLRRYELAVRQALGARPRQLLRQLLRDYLPPVAAGCLLTVVVVAIFLKQSGAAITDYISLLSLSCLSVLLLTIGVILHRSRLIVLQTIQQRLQP